MKSTGIITRIFALVLAAALIGTLCACSAGEETEESAIADISGGKGSDSADTEDTEETADDEGVKAIGVANPYTEIDGSNACGQFGIKMVLPDGAQDAHWFDVNTGSDTHMLQLQFVYDGVQYVMRARAASKQVNICAVYTDWDNETACEISGCSGTLYTNSAGAGAVQWYDPYAGATFALSASSGAVSSVMLELAELIYPGNGSGETEEKTEEAAQETPAAQEEEQPETEEKPQETTKTVRVYYPAQDGVSFTYTTYSTAKLSGEYLVARLKEAGVLGSGVECVWTTVTQIDEAGNCEVALCLTGEFNTMLAACDAKGEYMLMGSVVNTFIDAFGASRLWLYVDDAPAVGSVTYNTALTEYADYTGTAEETQPEEDAQEETQEAEEPEQTLAEKICETAQSKIGAEYEYGAEGPDKFDNSGFVYWCFKENGVTIARRTSVMWTGGTEVSYDNLKPGDVVFFTYEEDRSPSYVGIYLGDGKFIAESRAGNPVKIMDITTTYWKEIYVGARRYT